MLTSSPTCLKRALVASVLVAIAVPFNYLSAQTDEDVGIEEVLVTARKKEESLQDVPIAVSVYSGAYLEEARIDDVADLLAQIPGVGYGQPMKSFTPLGIRGGSSQDDYPGADPNVAIFVDEVFLGTTTTLEFDLLDLERVEVLRGPQGTLFGRNTNGGIIHFVTRDPDEEFRARASVTAGNYERLEFSGMVSGRIVDGVFGSLAAKSRNTGGYSRNLVTGSKLGKEDIASMRGKLLFTPNEQLDIVITGDYMADNSFGIPQDFLGGQSQLMRDLGIPAVNGLDQVSQDLDGHYDRESLGLVASISYDLGSAIFHSITAYRDYQGEMFNRDFDAVNAKSSNPLHSAEAFPYQNTEVETFTQEIRVDWDIGDRIDLVTGFYYLDQKNRRDEVLNPNGLPGSEASAWTTVTEEQADQLVNSKSYAVFFDTTIDVTEQVAVFGGYRWTRDEKDGTFFCHVEGGFWCSNVFESDFSGSWEEPTWRVGANFHFNDDIMVYASYAEGFKSGGFTGAGAGNFDDQGNPTGEESVKIPYDPEFTDSWEVGLRSQWLDNRITANITYFDVIYKDLQYLILRPAGFWAGNIGHAKNDGIETEFSFRVTDNFNLWANYTHQSGKYGGGASNYGGDSFDGNPLKLTPKHSFAMGGSYDHPLPNGSAFRLSGDWTEKSRQLYAEDSGPGDSAKFAGLINLQGTWFSPTERFEVQLWVRNLLNKRDKLGNWDDFFQEWLRYPTETDYIVDIASFSPPRYFGATVTWHFK
ncbi:MAG: TonB-dependent receptor [Gammaproteobacteria bacterium]|nr:TonB-dependent receptor [Gammaproteobacteria bacterium]